jgi:uncharacterized protein (TIGR02300 family)
VTKHDLGKKHLCTNCGVKFYDLTKTPPTCPKCETVAELVERPRTTRSASKSKPKPVPVKPVVEEEAVAAVNPDEESAAESTDDDEASDDVIEDVSELGEDEADLAGVVAGEDDTT